MEYGVFFFSSRRRHTRLVSDWSSDVCSSDLEVLGFPVVDRWPDRGAVWVMAGDRTRIGLWTPQVGLHGGRGGLHVHFAMQIAEEDFDATVALLEGRGQTVKIAVFGTTHGRAAYVDDPDGNVVEFWT